MYNFDELDAMGKRKNALRRYRRAVTNERKDHVRAAAASKFTPARAVQMFNRYGRFAADCT